MNIVYKKFLHSFLSGLLLLALSVHAEELVKDESNKSVQLSTEETQVSDDAKIKKIEETEGSDTKEEEDEDPDC